MKHHQSPKTFYLLLRIGVLKICSKFTGEHKCQSSFRHGCAPVNLLHIFRIPFPRNTSEGLLLWLYYFIGSLLTCESQIVYSCCSQKKQLLAGTYLTLSLWYATVIVQTRHQTGNFELELVMSLVAKQWVLKRDENETEAL